VEACFNGYGGLTIVIQLCPPLLERGSKRLKSHCSIGRTMSVLLKLHSSRPQELYNGIRQFVRPAELDYHKVNWCT
jgi:hypothetical protein